MRGYQSVPLWPRLHWLFPRRPRTQTVEFLLYGYKILILTAALL